MSVGLAPRPSNEEQRVKAVVKTGLIDNPNPELFQVYCDLAKDITGFSDATFSLYDGEMQCAIAITGRDPSEKKPGDKGLRTEHNVCSYVLLDTEPIIVEDFYLDKDWSEHPYIKSGDAPHSYAGFPVINKDNYALGTLCLFNTERKKLPDNQIELIKKITRNIAHLLDLQVEQRSLTADKIIKASDVMSNEFKDASLSDFNSLLLIEAGVKVEESKLKNLISNQLCNIDQNSNVNLTSKGRILIQEMGLTPKPMKRIKITGNEASDVIDKMFDELQ
jgi:GAF domain-containing protein